MLPTFWQKLTAMLKALFTSRKFWALIGALVTILAGYSTGEMTVWQAVQYTVAALMAFSTGIALEDGLSRRG